MPRYAYRVRDKSGGLSAGVIEARDEYAAVGSLRSSGYSVIKITPEAKRYGFEPASLKRWFKRIRRQEVIVFTRQLATLMRAGNTLTFSLDNAAEQIPNPRLKELVKRLSRDVQAGASFSEAAAKYPRVFDRFFISMVKVGEAGGILDEVLERLAVIGAEELEIRMRVASALVYPVSLILLSFLVVNFILIAVLPQFVSIFQASQMSLPLPTRIILGMSWVLNKLWPVILGVAVFLGLGLKRYRASSQGMYDIDARILRLPLFGELYLKVMISRFSRAMAALTKSGIPFLESLSVVENTIPNLLLKKRFKEMRYAVSRGENLTEVFKASGIFPPMVIQLINSGEKSGKLDEMFLEIVSFYEPEIEYVIRNLTAVLEPVLLLIMGLMVGFIALSVLLPIFNLIKAIRY